MNTTGPRLRARSAKRETISAYIETDSVDRLDALVVEGVVANRSAAIDEALRLYLTVKQRQISLAAVAIEPVAA